MERDTGLKLKTQTSCTGVYLSLTHELWRFQRASGSFNNITDRIISRIANLVATTQSKSFLLTDKLIFSRDANDPVGDFPYHALY